jgi:hypothetical protein
VNLHVSRVRRGATVYVYGQLVESYRREDGMPTQRVIANLGRMSEVEIRNMRVALEASRRGTRVVLDKRELATDGRSTKPTHNLRYLDLAVLLALWREWDLDSVLEAVLPRNTAEVAAWDVIAALTLQRCVDPGSKLYAEQWFPTTALPELLGVDPARFNNARLHRVLEQLDEATPQLMQRLTRHTHGRGEFATLFLDVTDARFTGNGPDMAEKAKTKEGIVERKVGIVLLCNERGFPLRWSVIPGRRADATAMHDVFEDIRGLDWLGSTPVVCDRSMGTSADLAKLLRTHVHFVTGLRCNEWTSYTTAIPHDCLAELAPSADETQDGALALEAVRRVTEAGMQQVSSTLYVLDLGLIDRGEVVRAAPPHGPSDIRRALLLAAQLQAEGRAAGNFSGAARRLGVSVGMSKAYRQLLKLDAELQQEILDGRADMLSVRGALKVAALADGAQQRQMFERLRSARTAPPARSASTGEITGAPYEAEAIPLRVRAAVTFNPELFVDKRRRAQQQLDDVRRFVVDLNEQLARPRSSRSRRDIEAVIDRVLRQRDLLGAFHVRIDEQMTEASTRYYTHVELDLEVWRHRRAHDGFGVIVAHPDETRTAVEICQLYRAKDAVEKDFQVIKSLIRVRPIWHRTDPKVRAHVTICMLALLLERVLNERLANVSAAHAIQVLSTCCLNRFAGTRRADYVVTHPDEAQQALLRELGLAQLAEDDYIVERLQAR